MHNLLVIALIVFALCLPPCEAKEKEFLVTKVIDGNTFMLENGDIVRYQGIDAPHLKKNEGGPQFYAREAMKYSKGLVLLKKVRLEFDADRKDAEGRLLAYVYVKNTFVNGELVRLGYARANARPPNLMYRDMLLRYEKEASSKYAGLWQEEKSQTNPYYIGNKRTYTFHKPSCPLSNKIPEKNRIIFRDRVDPIRIGYVPCRLCRP
ncbi:MAG: thermonuclease family protein [Syntrophorhabdales bacterium]|jgi:endonuclease YncB( thermonuclease family)